MTTTTMQVKEQLRRITKDEKIFQKATLDKYRDKITGFVPSLQDIARLSDTNVGTAASFTNGNSSNGKIRALLKDRAIKNLKPLPPDVKKLLDIWSNTLETS